MWSTQNVVRNSLKKFSEIVKIQKQVNTKILLEIRISLIIYQYCVEDILAVPIISYGNLPKIRHLILLEANNSSSRMGERSSTGDNQKGHQDQGQHARTTPKKQRGCCPKKKRFIS